MLGYINGKVLAILPNSTKFANIVITPGKNNENIGYNVLTTKNVASNIVLGNTFQFWIYHYISERDSILLGITTLERLKLFYKVVNVSGIGPKVALTLVEFFDDPAILLTAIKDKDTDTISKVPGLGKKTAAKLVLSLINTIDSLDFIPQETKGSVNKLSKYPQYNLIVSSLKNLGFSRGEINNLINVMQQPLEEAILQGKDIEYLLKLVLSAKT